MLTKIDTSCIEGENDPGSSSSDLIVDLVGGSIFNFVLEEVWDSLSDERSPIIPIVTLVQDSTEFVC